MELEAVAFCPFMQTGVPHCVSYTTVNQRNQEIKHLNILEALPRRKQTSKFKDCTQSFHCTLKYNAPIEITVHLNCSF